MPADINALKYTCSNSNKKALTESYNNQTEQRTVY